MTAGGRSRRRAWADLARAGNLPSVWSNVLAALVLASPAVATGAGTRPWPPGSTWLAATVLGSLAYAAGAMLNDVADADIDRRLGRDRAIPSGLVSRRTAAWVAGAMLVTAMLLFVALGASWVWTGTMVVAIASYDWLHKRWAGSVLLMAACRGSLGMTVASLPAQQLTPALLGWVLALSTYIVGLSVLARTEFRTGASRPGVGRWVGRLLALMPLVDAAALAVTGAWAPAAACAAAVPLGRGAQRLFAST